MIKSKDFFLNSISWFKSLDPAASPVWGIMTPQHMVEHLVGTWRISNGRATVPLKLAPEEVEKRRSFLFSDQPYPRNIANPLFERGLLPLRKGSLSEAADQLEDEMKAFFIYHETNSGAEEMHPVFGPLDYNGWLLFQSKHMLHHMKQFGWNEE